MRGVVLPRHQPLPDFTEPQHVAHITNAPVRAILKLQHQVRSPIAQNMPHLDHPPATGQKNRHRLRRHAAVTVHVLILPVHWGEPERHLPLAVAKWKPVLLLGLGEGMPGHVAIERMARNHAAHPDEANVPAPATLDPSGPATRAARFACDLSWFTASKVPVQLSDDAGDFLCNSLFYTALAQPVAHAGFVHLPPQGDVAEQVYVESLLPIVVTVIERNLAR